MLLAMRFTPRKWARVLTGESAGPSRRAPVFFRLGAA
jgi:hypothetical protein